MYHHGLLNRSRSARSPDTDYGTPLTDSSITVSSRFSVGYTRRTLAFCLFRGDVCGRRTVNGGKFILLFCRKPSVLNEAFIALSLDDSRDKRRGKWDCHRFNRLDYTACRGGFIQMKKGSILILGEEN